MTSVLFVCLGNICRSPAAEGMLRNLIQKEPDLNIVVKSSGTGDWHLGQLPDIRMRDVAKLRGLTLTSRAQLFKKEFLDEFDYILVADQKVLHDLYLVAEDPKHKAKIHLMTEFSSSYKGQDIPDPFYGHDADFHRVLDILEDSCEGLIEHIKRQSADK